MRINRRRRRAVVGDPSRVGPVISARDDVGVYGLDSVVAHARAATPFEVMLLRVGDLIHRCALEQLTATGDGHEDESSNVEGESQSGAGGLNDASKQFGIYIQATNKKYIVSSFWMEDS